MYDVVLKGECRGGPWGEMYPPRCSTGQRRHSGGSLGCERKSICERNPAGTASTRLPPLVDQAASLWVTLVKIALTETPAGSIHRPRSNPPGYYRRITTVHISFFSSSSMGTRNPPKKGLTLVSIKLSALNRCIFFSTISISTSISVLFFLRFKNEIF